MIEDEGIIYECVVPDSYNRGEFEDIAEAYRVVANPRAMSGIVVYSKYRDEWQANVGSMRPLIRHLLDELNKE